MSIDEVQMSEQLNGEGGVEAELLLQLSVLGLTTCEQRERVAENGQSNLYKKVVHIRTCSQLCYK